MSFVPTPDGAKVVVSFVVNGAPWSNTLWFSRTGFTLAELNDLTEAIDTYYGGPLKALLSSDGSYVRTKAYDMRTVDGPTSVDVSNAGVGTNAADALPVGSPLVISLYTAGRGRSSRGRIYISGLGEDHFESGAYDGTISAAVLALFQAAMGEVADAGWTHVINSYQQDGVVLTTAVTRPVTFATVRSNIPGSQRRRSARP